MTAPAIPTNLLTVPDAPDLTPFLVQPLVYLEREVGLIEGRLDELFALMEAYPQYHEAYLRVATGAAQRVSGAVLQRVRRAQVLVAECSAAVSKSYERAVSPDVLALAELLADIEDALAQLTVLPLFLGVETAVDGSPVATAVSYQVRQGDTLESIALTLLGDPEQWVRIALFNDLNLSVVGGESLLTPWIGEVLQVPTDQVAVRQAAQRDPSVYDVAVGVRALGRDFPLELTARTREDGTVDLTVLDETNTVLQGLSTRIETLLGTLPDAPDYGSFVPALLGSDLGEMTDRMLQEHITATLRADPRVAEVLDFSLERGGDAVTVSFQLRLFNGLTLPELWAVYDVRSA